MTTYIFTVGTGTAGRHSNLAQGLINSIMHCVSGSRVDLFPSASPDSDTLAQMVVEQACSQRPDLIFAIPAKFSDPDDLLACRHEFRALLRTVRDASPATHVVVNPTSGTKQMTAAATLACLDEGIGRIEFITGDRLDGVVCTGTERITAVDAARLMAERRLRDIRLLLGHGDYAAAARLGREVVAHFPLSAAVAATLAAWNRLDYTESLRAASGHEALANTRRMLSRLREANEVSLDRAADILALAERELAFDRPEEALSAVYRCVELLAKTRLAELGCPPELHYAEHLIASLSPNEALKGELRRLAGPQDRCLLLGLEKSLRLLEPTGFPLCGLSREHRNILSQRNETRFGHGAACVPAAEVARLHDAVSARAANQWPGFAGLLAATRFPDPLPLLDRELSAD
jgi:HEPN domain-containing protein